MNRLSLRTAAMIAWRETRSSMVKFLFVILAVAAGTGSLAGVRGFSESFRRMLLRDARSLMAADLWVRTPDWPTPEQTAALDRLASRGADYTMIAETVSLAAGPQADEAPALVSLKVVDPAKYPFYGQVKLRPDISLRQALTLDSVAVSEDLLARVHTQVGDVLRMGGQDFRVAAVVVSEPDRMTGTMNAGFRVMMSREGLDRAGLIRPGSRSWQRLLFKLAPGTTEDSIRPDVQRIFPRSMMAGLRQTNPIITRSLDRVTVFLSLVSLIALIVGALGVGMAMHAHLQARMDHIAVMKSIGGRSREIMRIYLLQTLMLGLGGGVVGVLVGRGIELAFPALIARYFSLRPDGAWSASAAGQAIGLGLLTTLLFTLPPLLAIRRVRPAMILRRNLDEARLTWRVRWETWRASFAVALLILGGIALIAAWLADSQRMGNYFAGGLAGSLLGLSLVAWLMLRGIRLLLRGGSFWLPPMLRHGLLNLDRQGSQAQAILVALGLGVMFTHTVYLVQDSLVEEITRSSPRNAPNVILFGLTPQESAAAVDLIRRQPGVEGEPEIAAIVRARLLSVDGVKISDISLRGWGRRFQETRSVICADELSPRVIVVAGKWWSKGDPKPLVSVSEESADELGIKLGSRMELTGQGRTFEATVAAFHQNDRSRNGPNAELIFNAKALEGLPATYYGGVRMKPSSVGAFQKAMYQKFPSATVINVADALAMVEDMIDQLALVLRFLSALAILAGAIILAASVAGTRFRRIREVAILKTLGATRRYVLRLFSVEFLGLGAVAGLLGSLLAAVFSSLLLNRFFDAPFQFDLRTTLLATLVTALLANASGWMASARVLGQKPLEALRDE